MAWSGWLTAFATERIQLRLRDSVFAHLLRLPAGYVDERRPGDLMVRLLDDVAVVEGAVASGPVSLVTSVALASQALVQAFSRQDAESGRLHREGVSWLRAKMTETRLDSIYAPLVYFLETCCMLIVFGVGARPGTGQLHRRARPDAGHHRSERGRQVDHRPAADALR